MKKQYISPNLQVHVLQIEGGAWTNKKGNSIWDNMRENDEY